MKQTLLLFLCGIFPSCKGGGSSWNYKSGDEAGPDHWQGECGGAGQSPINIDTEETTEETEVEAFEISDYDQVPLRSVLVNNGHSAKLSSEFLSKSLTPRVSGGGLGHSYRFGQVHFHWGDAASRGSEHTVDGAAFALEMHLVHFKAELEDISAAVAEGKQDSLAVLGFLFQESETGHPGLDQLLAHFPLIQKAGARVEVTSSALASLIPDTADLGGFWRYEGGLTTPTCDEIVQWTVFKQPLNISAAQLEQFRSLLTHDGEPLVNNFRPTQPVNGRRVSLVQTGRPRWCSVFNPSSAFRISCPVSLLGVISLMIFYQR